MWDIMLAINSILWVIAGVYLIYAFGTAILTWSGKPLLIALAIFVFFSVAEIVLNGIVDP
jgi:hypothetical protein